MFPDPGDGTRVSKQWWWRVGELGGRALTLPRCLWVLLCIGCHLLKYTGQWLGITMLGNIDGELDFWRKKHNGHSKNVCRIFDVNFPLWDDVEMTPFYLRCRPSERLLPGDSKCHVDTQRVLLMTVFVFKIFQPWDTLETRFHVILGNGKRDWALSAGFPLWLWYWRRASFLQDSPSTRQANDMFGHRIGNTCE